VNRDFLARWSRRLFMAIGVVILVVGAVMFVRTVRFVAEAEHTTGTVVDLSRRSDSEGTVFYPVVRFVTANAETIEFVSSSGPLRRPSRPATALRFSTTQTIRTARN
jgi:Protein of unknown function (DUF3592)